MNVGFVGQEINCTTSYSLRVKLIRTGIIMYIVGNKLLGISMGYLWEFYKGIIDVNHQSRAKPDGNSAHRTWSSGGSRKGLRGRVSPDAAAWCRACFTNVFTSECDSLSSDLLHTCDRLWFTRRKKRGTSFEIAEVGFKRPPRPTQSITPVSQVDDSLTHIYPAAPFPIHSFMVCSHSRVRFVSSNERGRHPLFIRD